jgi:hypothetical protein
MKLRDSTQRPHAASRSKLATALSAALIGGAVLATPAQAVSLADAEGLGDAVIYQYFTAQNGWQTFFRIINTSTDAVVVKVRYREAANSREILDFEIALSPNDMWTGWTDPSAIGDGRPGVKTNDTSCLFPLVGQASPPDEGFVVVDAETNEVGAVFKDRAFTGVYNDGGPDAALRLAEGHFEIIGVAAYAPESNFGFAVSHQASDGKPENCAAAYSLYSTGRGDPSFDVGNVLAANAYLVNIASGQGAGYDPNVLADCAAASLRSIANATDTSPDLDDCDAGPFGLPAQSVDDVRAWNGTVAINQALWNGAEPAPIQTTIYLADLDGSGDFAGAFTFDVNQDGVCDATEAYVEDNVPESVYNAAASDPLGYTTVGAPAGCTYYFATTQVVGPQLTTTQIQEVPDAWRLKQKGQVTYAPDPDAPFTVTNEFLVGGGVDWVSAWFMADSVINEWAASFNPTGIISDYFTQWVVTFPTKHYYVDLQNDLDLTDDISPTLARTVPASFSPFYEIFPGNGESCEPVTIEMWNREERFSDFTSPAPTPENSLCWETNVVAFNERYADAGLDSNFSLVVDQSFLPTDYDGSISERGWARMTFDGLGARTGLLTGPDNPVLTGLPVTGFMFSVYETGNAATNHTTANAHKYEREEATRTLPALPPTTP